jgi:hypothetical protein
MGLRKEGYTDVRERGTTFTVSRDELDGVLHNTVKYLGEYGGRKKESIPYYG